MNSNHDSLEDFADRLAEVRPSKANAQLAHRLEMTLHQADQDLKASKEPTNVIYHPFVQWSLAAAALFVALTVAFESTRFEPASGFELAGVDEPAALPVYKLVDGKMMPLGGGSADGSLQRISYQGLEVVNGRAYKRFQAGDATVYQVTPWNHKDVLNESEASAVEQDRADLSSK